LLAACPGGTGGSETDTDGPGPNGSVLLGIGLSPNDPIASVDDTIAFESRAFYEDTSVEVVTDLVQWVSTDTRIATIDSNGVATAIAPGVTEIIATHPDGPSAKVNLTVAGANAELTGVTLSPDPVSVPSGQTAQMVANGSFSDGSSGNVAASCTWTTDNAGTASIGTSGLLTGVSVGSTNVTGTCGAFSDTAPVNVTNGSVGSADLTVSYANVVGVDGQLDFSLIIENDGTSATSSVTLRAYQDLDQAPTSSTPADVTYQLPPLAAGASIPLHLTVDDVSPGTYNTWVWVDATGTANESNENNNVSGPHAVTLSAGEADLMIYSVETLSDGETTLYEVEIENIGESDASSFYVDIFVDQLADPEVGDYGDAYEEIYFLAAGDYDTLLIEAWGGPDEESWWDSIIFVDSADDISESDEGNNIEYVTVFVD